MAESVLDGVEPLPAIPRAKMVEAARKFMMTPKVRETPFEEQKRFLLGKGLTEGEIEEARRTLPPPEFESTSTALSNISGNGQVQAPSTGNGFLRFANTVIVLGSISYAGYRFLRSVVLPRFFDVPDPALEEQRQLQQQIADLQNSMKFVMDSVVQTLQTVNQQQEQLNALLLMNSNEGRSELQRLQNDISIVKSLLLNQNQFAAIPANVGARPNSCAVPAWQKVKNVSEGSATMSNGYQTPSADSDIHAEELVHDTEVNQTLNTAPSEGSSV